MIGASLTAIASFIVSGDTCEMSTSMPSQFISRTTCSPNGDRPPSGDLPAFESAQGRSTLWVSVM